MVSAAALLAAALTGGCAATDDGALGERLRAHAIAGDFNAIAVTNIRCNAATEACAKSHAVKGDACLRLAIQQPPDASLRDSRVQALLDCAERGYRKALALQPDRAARSRTSYHGGLLLTLSERRNRMDNVGAQQLHQQNEKLLMATRDTRREAPDSALGFLYGASAHLYRTTLRPPDRERCNDLRQAETMLKRSPAPPHALADEHRRMRSLVQRQLRENDCSPQRSI